MFLPRGRGRRCWSSSSRGGSGTGRSSRARVNKLDEHAAVRATRRRARLSTLKSQSTKGGNGYNEVRFDDRKGDEQLFFHAGARSRDLGPAHGRADETYPASGTCASNGDEFRETRGHAQRRGARQTASPACSGSVSAATMDHAQPVPSAKAYALNAGPWRCRSRRAWAVEDRVEAPTIALRARGRHTSSSVLKRSRCRASRFRSAPAFPLCRSRHRHRRPPPPRDADDGHAQGPQIGRTR